MSPFGDLAIPEPVWTTIISGLVYVALHLLRNLFPTTRKARKILSDLVNKDENNETSL
jgi:hypothetical protein